jgi:hypothetical protein
VARIVRDAIAQLVEQAAVASEIWKMGCFALSVSMAHSGTFRHVP